MSWFRGGRYRTADHRTAYVYAYGKGARRFARWALFRCEIVYGRGQLTEAVASRHGNDLRVSGGNDLSG